MRECLLVPDMGRACQGHWEHIDLVTKRWSVQEEVMPVHGKGSGSQYRCATNTNVGARVSSSDSVSVQQELTVMFSSRQCITYPAVVPRLVSEMCELLSIFSFGDRRGGGG